MTTADDVVHIASRRQLQEAYEIAKRISTGEGYTDTDIGQLAESVVYYVETTNRLDGR